MSNMGYYVFRPVIGKNSYKEKPNQHKNNIFYETKLEKLDKEQALFAKGQHEGKRKRKKKQDKNERNGRK